ncbi:hypothetical protein LguiB_017206 [Lonicera macranthoides]
MRSSADIVSVQGLHPLEENLGLHPLANVQTQELDSYSFLILHERQMTINLNLILHTDSPC